MRINGELTRLDAQADTLGAWDTEKVLHELLSEKRLKVFQERHELDGSHVVPGLSTFRVNAYMQRGLVAIVIARSAT